MAYTLRSHEQSKDGFNVQATYEILNDGKVLGFSDMFRLLDVLNGGRECFFCGQHITDGKPCGCGAR